MTQPHRPLRLAIDREALLSNWRWLAGMSGPAACGAAVKADAYGIGARETVLALSKAGCRNFFVSTWAEAEPLLPLLEEGSLSVFHGLAPEDLRYAAASRARPVLNTPLQIRRWREQAPGRPCDVMIDTGMHRLGVSPAEVSNGVLDGLEIETLMSHLACADEDVAANQRQLELFRAVAASTRARRYSLSNSAGICLGSNYAFDLTRPGLALYGGTPRREAEGMLRQVVRIEAQVVQRRLVPEGGAIGYNATVIASQPMELAILNVGYADGYLRSFSDKGRARIGDRYAPVVGRVSMDLTAIAVDGHADVCEGDWVELDFDLTSAAQQSGLSQYELLTSLGSRYARHWQ